MNNEFESRLPFNNNFDVFLQIRIHAFHNGEFTADIQADHSAPYRFNIEMTREDVKRLNTRLQRAIENASPYFNQKENNEEEQKTQLNRLASEGLAAFKRIFGNIDYWKEVRNALTVGVNIQITAEEFFIPWELLYDGPIGEQFNIKHFWGMKHIISRAIVQRIRPGVFVSQTIRTAIPFVGLIAYKGLTHVVEEEIPSLKSLDQNKKIKLNVLRDLNNDNSAKEFKEFSSFLSNELHILHLAGHAYSGKITDEPYLLISEEFIITMNDFITHNLIIKKNPFAILNACLTGMIDPLLTSNWVRLFWRAGVRGVLATEFHVPDSFASTFIIKLYQNLLRGIPIGRSLFNARLFFGKIGNPLGLAYALYSSPDLKLKVVRNNESESNRQSIKKGKQNEKRNGKSRKGSKR